MASPYVSDTSYIQGRVQSLRGFQWYQEALSLLFVKKIQIEPKTIHLCSNMKINLDLSIETLECVSNLIPLPEVFPDFSTWFNSTHTPDLNQPTYSYLSHRIIGVGVKKLETVNTHWFLSLPFWSTIIPPYPQI